MTYNMIIELLQNAGMYATASALARAVEDEATALMEGRLNKPANRVHAEKAARDFYAEDITRQLADHEPLTPDRVLYQRRTPTVWAIAEILIKNKLAGTDALHMATRPPPIADVDPNECD